MKEIKRVHIIGLGGIGCAYASKLFDLDNNLVKVIADQERIKRYTQKGFVINSKKYDFDYTPIENTKEIADLILVCVKYHDLNQAIKNMKNFVGKDTIILSLLNGVTSEEILGEEFGMEKVLYGMCVGIDAVREDNIVHFSSTGKINFGEKENSKLSKKVQAVKNVLDRAQIPYEIPVDMMRKLWWKYMINVGINQASAVLGAPYEVFNNVSEARSLMEDAMREVISLSEKINVNLNEKDIEDWYNVLKNLDPKNKTSMLQDIEAGRKTEVEMFAGYVCEMGERFGVDTKVNRSLYNIIRVLEEMGRR